MSSPHRAAVTIGINYDRFPPDVDPLVQTRAGLNRLQFAEADAEDLAQELESAGYAVVLLTGAAATRRAIIDAITRQRQAVAPDGLLLIHFSGHGDVDADGNAYLLPADADPRHLLATAIPLDDLAQRYLGRLEAAVTLLDCCHSGYAVGMRGGEGAARDERGEARTFLNQARATFQQVRGRIVLAACGGDQLARELADLRHGAFTYYMLEHLRTNPDAVDVELLYRDIDQGLEGRGLPPPVRGGATLGRIILRDPRPERLPGPVSPFVPDPNQDQRVQLRQALLMLSADQLDEVLFRLSLTYERLAGSDHNARLRNLIRSLDQAGQLATLAQALDDMRAAAQAAREQAEREAARLEQERLDHERQEREQAERVRAEAAREEARPPATRWTALKRLVPERQERDRQEQRRRAPAHGAAEQHAGPQVAPAGQQDSEPPLSATATTPIGSAKPLTQEKPPLVPNAGQATDAAENRMARTKKTRLSPKLTRLARVIAGAVVLLILMGVTYLYINRDTSRITLRGHTDVLLSAAYSPDGKTIVTASKDGTTKIWDAASGQELRTLRGHTGWVISAAYSPDGKTIVTASGDHTAKIWDAASGQELRTLFGHIDLVSRAAYSPDGKTIITASWDKTAKIWDAANGQELRTLSGHTDQVNSAAYSPDGKTIVTASKDGTAKIWDAASGQELRTLNMIPADVSGAAYSPNGKTIVTASVDWVKFWDAASGQDLGTLHMNLTILNSMAYSPDGKTIVTANGDHTAKIWDAANGQELRTLSGHTDWVISAVYSPDGKTIVTTSWDKTAKIWDAQP